MRRPRIHIPWPARAGSPAGATAGPSHPDGKMLRTVRLHLMAWSAGSTLVVLIVLGAALYCLVAQTLAGQSTTVLEDRIAMVGAKVEAASGDGIAPPSPVAASSAASPETRPSVGPSPAPAASPSEGQSAYPSFDASASASPAGGPANVSVTVDPAQPGLVLGGPSSGSIAFILDPLGGIASKSASDGEGGWGGLDIPEPAKARQEAALAGQTVVWEEDLHGIPARYVLAAVQTTSGPVLIVAIGDRTPEINVLRTLLRTILLGGLAALAAAALFGYFYASRALVPIRSSLQRQRDFAADASHELRTPLAIVRGAAEELKSDPTNAAARARSVADIEAGAERLRQLVEDLLLLARADSGALELRLEEVDLGEVATDAAARLGRLAAEKSIRLRVDVVPAPVRGDPERLGQLVAILVDNAIRHSPEGTAVEIVVRDGAKLAVSDSGPGIRREDESHLFDRFWRAADAPAGGTGLGLAIADWIARAHGGTVSAANDPRGGARFEATIPAARQPAAR
jgi:signal transduction histidine kinase